MTIPTRKSVKILLFNDQNKLLFMLVDDPKITSVNGDYYGPFWIPIGGGIEKNETIQKAALRELFEETGITLEEKDLGPVIFFGEFDLCMNKKLMHIKQFFLPGKTTNSDTTLSNLTKYEKKVVKNLSWFSLEEIQRSNEIFYPILLLDHLPKIFAGKYPESPLEIDLTKQPNK